MSRTKQALGIFVGLLIVYMINPAPLLGNDSRPAYLVAVSFLKRGDCNLDEYADTFRFKNGDLPYFAVQTPSGHVVSRFGVGSALAATPVFLPMLLYRGGKIDERTALHLGKLASALFVAGAAAFLFLVALELSATPLAASAVALVYGLCTCAFSVVAQTLWQHGPSEFFLVLAMWLLLRGERRHLVLSGVALAAMVVCRPPNAILAVVATGYAVHRHRKGAALLLMGALPIALAQAGYNHHYFGAPWRFAQMSVVKGIDALPEESYWRNSPLVGIAGLLISPSRGLFIYSPVFWPLLVWPVVMWKNSALLIRYLFVGVIAIVLMVASYYGWYGGWCFGYRMIVDTMPIIPLFMLGAFDRIVASRAAKLAFVGAFVLSIAIHAVGAYAYDAYGWDGEPNLDFHHERLWSIKDGQLAYWFSHLHWRTSPE